MDSVEKYNTPNEKHKIKKSRKKCYKKTIESLHKQIKSDYKEILKKQLDKPIKMNDVSRNLKLQMILMKLIQKNYYMKKINV